MEAAVKTRDGRELFEEVKKLSSKRELSNQESEFIKRFRSRYGPTTPVPVEKDWDKLDEQIQETFIRFAPMLKLNRAEMLVSRKN